MTTNQEIIAKLAKRRLGLQNALADSEIMTQLAVYVYDQVAIQAGLDLVDAQAPNTLEGIGDAGRHRRREHGRRKYGRLTLPQTFPTKARSCLRLRIATHHRNIFSVEIEAGFRLHPDA